MNVTPVQIASAHLTVNTIADSLAKKWAEANTAAEQLRVDSAWKPGAALEARGRISTFQSAMKVQAEASFRELSLEIDGKPIPPPLSDHWDQDQLGTATYNAFGTKNHLRADLLTLAGAIRDANTAIKENFFNIGSALPTIQRVFAPLRGIAERHEELYFAADVEAQSMGVRPEQPERIASAAAAGVIAGAGSAVSATAKQQRVTLPVL